MEVWIPGALALVGALAGVLLTNYLTRATKRSDAKRARLEEALRCVVLAISARNFATRAGAAGKPSFVSDEDVQGIERQIYLDNIERMFVTLRDARHAVALLVADGIDVGDSWRGDDELQADLERLYGQLRELLKSTSR